MIELVDTISYAVSTALMFVGLAVMAFAAWEVIQR